MAERYPTVAELSTAYRLLTDERVISEHRLAPNTRGYEQRAQIVNHLVRHGCTDLDIGELGIGKHKFPAVFFTQTGQRRAYVIGERPPILKRKRKMALRINGGPDDWYVAAYMDASRLTAQFAPVHPVGANFMLALWSVPSGDAIDAHYYWRGKRKSYLRELVTFEAVPQIGVE